jgi:hypothetical protein
MRSAIAISLSLAGSLLAAEPDITPAEAGAKYQKNCMGCHQPPDLDFATDRAWIGQIQRTAWSGHAPQSVRAALIKFFEARSIDPPRAITAPPAGIDASTTDGFVRSNIPHGSLFLKDAHGKITRLAWKPTSETKPSTRLRALPPGTYTLTGYRIVRTDDTGTTWHISTLSPHGIRKVQVKPALPVEVRIDPTVHINASGHIPEKGPNVGKFAVTASILGQHHAGLTIYRAGKRIPLAYVITARGRDAALEKGALDYGWGGGAAAWSKLTKQQRASGITVSLKFQKPPFPLKGHRTFHWPSS